MNQSLQTTPSTTINPIEVAKILEHLITEPEAVYAAKRKDNLSSHALAEFRTCPLLFRNRQLGLLPETDSSAFLLGRAVHTLTLEGCDEYRQRFAVGGPINDKTGKPFGRDTKAFAEWAMACGKPVLSHDQAEMVERMAEAVQQHPVASRLLGKGVAERVIRQQYAGIACQCRLDWVHPELGLVDLKTCDDLTWFESDARRYGYAFQMAFYHAMLRQAAGVSVPVHLIGVEKREPFRCGVWIMSEQVLDHAEQENLAAMRRLEICIRDKVWPTNFEEVRVFDYL